MISRSRTSSGTITITAPANYAVSTNGTDYGPSATITAGPSYVGSVVSVRFAPTDSVAYNGELTVAHTSLTPDYGNTVPNVKPGAISLTGNGKVAIRHARPRRPGRCSRARPSCSARRRRARSARPPPTLSGLVNKNVNYSAARFDTPDGMWPAEGARNPSRYVEFTVPVTTGSFTLDTVSSAAARAAAATRAGTSSTR